MDTQAKLECTQCGHTFDFDQNDALSFTQNDVKYYIVRCPKCGEDLRFGASQVQ